MDEGKREVNKRFSKLYSTLLGIDTSQVMYNDLYKSDRFKQWLDKPEFGLYLRSNTAGSGKTTTAVKLCQDLVSRGYRVLALSFLDYKEILKGEFGNDKKFMEKVFKYDFIFLDDIGYGVNGEWAKEILKHLLDRCFNNKKPILILTAQVEVNSLPIPKAMQSRIKGITHPVQFKEFDRRANQIFNF